MKTLRLLLLAGILAAAAAFVFAGARNPAGHPEKSCCSPATSNGIQACCSVETCCNDRECCEPGECCDTEAGCKSPNCSDCGPGSAPNPKTETAKPARSCCVE